MYEELKPLEGVSIPNLSFWKWVKETFTPSYRDEIQEYLSQASDHADLEQRMQVLARRGMI